MAQCRHYDACETGESGGPSTLAAGARRQVLQACHGETGKIHPLGNSNFCVSSR